MPPVQDGAVREKRLEEGCCPNCGIRLYKVTHPHGGVGGLVNMPKLFRKKSANSNSGGGGGSNSNGPSPNPTKMTPLTIPGVVERGQCVKCTAGVPGGGGCAGKGGCNKGGDATMQGGHADPSTQPLLPTATAVPAFPTVKAVPAVATTAPAPTLRDFEHLGLATKPPPQSMPEASWTNNKQNGRPMNGANANSLGNVSNLKQPPEDLLGLNEAQFKSLYPPDGFSSDGESSSSGDSSSDARSMENDYPEHFDLCRIESDHASSSVVNNLKQQNRVGSGGVEDAVNDDDDDRKPAAKPFPLPNNIGNDNNNHNNHGGISQQIVESAERIRKLRVEAAAVDMAFLESATTLPPAAAAAASTSAPSDDALKCPSGMSPEVFYQLPPEMQREVAAGEDRAASSSSTAASSVARGGNGAAVAAAGEIGAGEDGGTAADIDPETLASLPDNIRKEVLEQARMEQRKRQRPINRPKGRHRNASLRFEELPDPSVERSNLERQGTAGTDLSKSTTEFLQEFDMDADDFAAFPEELKTDILEERRRRNSTGRDEEKEETLDLVTKSGYDPETLASLPEDVRQEVLDEERRERERGRREELERQNKPPSTVGAHRVDTPAGYDPDTFGALPEDVQRELLEDAANRGRPHGATEGYDYDGLPHATVAAVVEAPLSGGGGAATSCTYTGAYNMMGKRHGDGDLKWANGDKYVGKFKDGYIEGRGTISFHDGTEYAGQWKTNRFHGEGTRRFINGNVYTGNYDSGKRQGQGRCYFANGDMYVGDWKEDTIHGFGRYYYNNGHSFEGMFRQGKRNGRGKYQLTDGRVEIYRYVNDSRVGDGVRWSANRKKAWRMNDGKVTKKVSMEEAAAIAKRCGPILEDS